MSTRADTPITTRSAGWFLITIAPAPTTVCAPTDSFWSTLALHPTVTSGYRVTLPDTVAPGSTLTNSSSRLSWRTVALYRT